MGISLVEILDDTEISSPALRKRAREESSKNQVTRHYLAFRDGVEMAFVSLDLYSDRDYLMLYELLVEPSLRGQGTGTAIVLEIEAMALRLGYQAIRVYPMPFMGDISEEVLVQWYQKLGFLGMQAGNEMQKVLRVERRSREERSGT